MLEPQQQRVTDADYHDSLDAQLVELWGKIWNAIPKIPALEGYCCLYIYAVSGSERPTIRVSGLGDLDLNAKNLTMAIARVKEYAALEAEIATAATEGAVLMDRIAALRAENKALKDAFRHVHQEQRRK